MKSKTYWLSTYGECLVDGGDKGFRDVRHMLNGQGAFCYAAKCHQAEGKLALARVEALEPGQETQTIGSWHPKHGATMVTIKRIS